MQGSQFNELARRVFAEDGRRKLILQSQGTLVLNILIFKRMSVVPPCETTGDNNADQKTDEKEQSIGGQGDQEDCDSCHGDEESGGAFDAETHEGIVAPKATVGSQ